MSAPPISDWSPPPASLMSCAVMQTLAFGFLLLIAVIEAFAMAEHSLRFSGHRFTAAGAAVLWFGLIVGAAVMLKTGDI